MNFTTDIFFVAKRKTLDYLLSESHLAFAPISAIVLWFEDKTKPKKEISWL